jgi:hypothetical protein
MSTLHATMFGESFRPENRHATTAERQDPSPPSPAHGAQATHRYRLEPQMSEGRLQLRKAWLADGPILCEDEVLKSYQPRFFSVASVSPWLIIFVFHEKQLNARRSAVERSDLRDW